MKNTTAIERAEVVSRARGESIEEVLRRFSTSQLMDAPKRFSRHILALRKATFIESGVVDDVAYVRTPDNHLFYGFKSRPNHRRAYRFVKDLISNEISEDTFLLALDIVQRFSTDYLWPPPQIHPPNNGTIVECGAYLGHKTIRFAEELVPQGRVLAIEMMPDNVSILRRNIEERGLENRVDVMEFGVWKESGEMRIRGKGRQRNTLVDLTNLSGDMGIVAKVESLDTLLDEWDQPAIDLLYVTVNGTEIETIMGLDRWLPSVSGIFIVSLYSREGQKCSELCLRLLRDKGCQILESSNQEQIVAKTSI